MFYFFRINCSRKKYNIIPIVANFLSLSHFISYLYLSLYFYVPIYNIIWIYVCPVASDLPCPGESIVFQRDWFPTLAIVTFLSLAIWRMSSASFGANSKMNFRFGNIENVCSVFSVYRVHIQLKCNIKYYNIPRTRDAANQL